MCQNEIRDAYQGQEDQNQSLQVNCNIKPQKELRIHQAEMTPSEKVTD